MKKIAILIFTFYAFVAYSADSLFKTADTLFQNNKTEEAISVYNKILDKNLESSELYYNIGICYFKMQNYNLSKENFRKSLSINPNSEITKKRIIQTNIKLNTKETPQLFYIIWKNKISEICNTNTWILFSILSILILLILFIFKLFFKKQVRSIYILSLICISVLMYFFSSHKIKKDEKIFDKSSTNTSQSIH